MDVYVDTSVWISALYSNDSNHERAVDFFNGITDDKICINDHIYIEVYEALRKEEIPFLKTLPPPLRNETVLRQQTEDKFKKFLSRVNPERPNIAYRGLTTSMDEHFRNVYNILRQVNGQIKPWYACPVCGARLNHPFLEYETSGRDDIHHAIIAKKSGCEKFVTFDKGFRFLQKLQYFSGITFEILQPVIKS